MNGKLYITGVFCIIFLLPFTLNGQQESVEPPFVTNAEPSHAHFLVGNGREINMPLNRDESGQMTSHHDFQFLPEWKGKQLFIRLSGMQSPFHLWINSFKYGSGEGLGIPVEFNVTPFLNPEKNTLRVELQPTDSQRDQDAHQISMIVRNPVHVRDFLVTDYTQAGSPETLVRVHLFIKSYLTEQNRGRILTMTISDPSGETICDQTRVLDFPMAFRQEVEVIFDQTISDPRHWSPHHPELYHLQLQLVEKGRTQGELVSSNFGIRNIVFNDSVLIINTDTIVPAIADKSVLNQFTSLTDEEILSLFEEKDYNAVQANEILPARVIELFDRQGILVLKKQEGRDPSRDRRDMNRPCVVWIE
ncbi:MAG: hypothetical protein KAR19_04505 [Bacteroidales bacterium]|nr:hypothetical protein [Bacteroidales bacterium]